MSIIDILIIIITVLGAFEGYKRGAIKQINDIVFLFISMILSSLLSGYITNFLYPYLPFFNFFGAAKGLKTINIIFYRVLIYLILIILFMIIIDKILIKLKLKEKIMDSMVDATKISQIVGLILSVPLMVLVVYNFLLIIILPIFNFNFESNISDTIMYNVPVVSKLNSNIYEAELLVKNQINSDENNYEEYEIVNEEISSILVDSGIIDENKIDILSGNNKLLGYKSKGSNVQLGGSDNKEGSSDDDQKGDYDDGDDEDDEDDEGNYEGEGDSGEMNCQTLEDDGVEVYACCYEDGTCEYEYENGTSVIQYEDGTYEYCYEDGTCFECDADGTCFELE